MEGLIDGYIEWYNAERPCWSLGYAAPNDFHDAFMAGEVEGRDTLKSRALDPAPKFMREKLARAAADAERGGIGTSDPLCLDAVLCVPVPKNSSDVHERDADSGSSVYRGSGRDEKNIYEA